MVQKEYLPHEYDTFIGIDVDKKSFSFTTMDRFNMKQSKRIPADPVVFYSYIKKNLGNKKIVCAYEAGPTGFHLYDYLNEKQIPCLLLSPNSIPKASNEKVKNNRIDSEKIAQHIRTNSAKSIRVPQNQYRELRHLINIRENYVELQKTAKQRIKALLLSAHLEDHLKDIRSNWSSRYIKELKKIPCPFAVRTRLDMLLMDLEYARSQILSLMKNLKKFCEDDKEISDHIQYLRSIQGIGFIIAASILGKIGDPKDLKNARELGAFIGLVPRESSTGDTVNRGSITHLGNQTLRFLLVEAAWVAIRKNTELAQFYHRIKTRHHPSIASKKAIVAVARKLTQIIYRVLKDQRMYVNYKDK
jgi:transposase